LKSFFKSFFASLLALVVFVLLLFFLLVGVASVFTSEEKAIIGEKAVLVIDLSKNFNEMKSDDPFAELSMKQDEVAPDLNTLIKIIKSAKSDSSIKGIYLMSSENPNGYASSNEIRNALLDFKKSKKFIIAYADYISEKAYYISNIADRIYCNPKGIFQWQGMYVDDDEVKDEVRKRLGLEKDKSINFIRLHKYEKSLDLSSGFAKDKIAMVIAEGEIVYGKGKSGQIGSDDYLSLLRKIRNDKNTKAVVLRVNSPGGSSLASEIIWRELELIRKEGKVVVVSMGDVAASGGYYISCNANRIFADPKTITGSIGVFAIVPDISGFTQNKLGITFDRVKTSEFADAPSLTRPMTDFESKIMQSQVDQIYLDFKTRVADGRKKTIDYIDSIAQGRVWTGARAKEIGLVDQLGSITDALAYAAKESGLKEYRLKVYPEPKTLIEQILDQYPTDFTEAAIKKNVGEDEYIWLKQIQTLKKEKGEIKTRLPFDLILH